jgi:hypothetical protein
MEKTNASVALAITSVNRRFILSSCGRQCKTSRKLLFALQKILTISLGFCTPLKLHLILGRYKSCQNLFRDGSDVFRFSSEFCHAVLT